MAIHLLWSNSFIVKYYRWQNTIYCHTLSMTIYLPWPYTIYDQIISVAIHLLGQLSSMAKYHFSPKYLLWPNTLSSQILYFYGQLSFMTKHHLWPYTVLKIIIRPPFFFFFFFFVCLISTNHISELFFKLNSLKQIKNHT